jgi:hypothetical protein
MRKLPVIVAAACTLLVAPAFAEQGSQPPTSNYGAPSGNYGGMRGMGGGRPYGEAEVRRHGERNWRGMQEGCKYITVRQRQGDEVIIRHFKRCD